MDSSFWLNVGPGSPPRVFYWTVDNASPFFVETCSNVFQPKRRIATPLSQNASRRGTPHRRLFAGAAHAKKRGLSGPRHRFQRGPKAKPYVGSGRGTTFADAILDPSTNSSSRPLTVQVMSVPTGSNRVTLYVVPSVPSDQR